MDARQIKRMYGNMCKMSLTLRRYAGAPGSRAYTDYAVMGHARLYTGKELIGTIAQGDLAIIVLADAIATAGLQLPILTADKIVLNGRERAILPPIGERKALDGTLIALELQARG